MNTADPLGGSYFVESLTDAMEEKIVGIDVIGDVNDLRPVAPADDAVADLRAAGVTVQVV